VIDLIETVDDTNPASASLDHNNINVNYKKKKNVNANRQRMERKKDREKVTSILSQRQKLSNARMSKKNKQTNKYS
jgi:hypothetical protein